MREVFCQFLLLPLGRKSKEATLKKLGRTEEKERTKSVYLRHMRARSGKESQWNEKNTDFKGELGVGS